VYFRTVHLASRLLFLATFRSSVAHPNLTVVINVRRKQFHFSISSYIENENRSLLLFLNGNLFISPISNACIFIFNQCSACVGVHDKRQFLLDAFRRRGALKQVISHPIPLLPIGHYRRIHVQSMRGDLRCRKKKREELNDHCRGPNPSNFHWSEDTVGVVVDVASVQPCIPHAMKHVEIHPSPR